MRTTVELDEKLLEEVLKLSGAKTKRSAIAKAMEEYVRMKKREELRAMIGNYEHGMTLKELRKVRDEG
ncbi:type II toxin-antitoxin system VapB family antitoxin [Candidatus Acetothermia bacterium]|nr:type II toxin-antitoxin system VapB family antitoxin [Candidatus Acetothermia bacterium]